jgi:hypothetical protein
MSAALVAALLCCCTGTVSFGEQQGSIQQLADEPSEAEEGQQLIDPRMYLNPTDKGYARKYNFTDTQMVDIVDEYKKRLAVFNSKVWAGGAESKKCSNWDLGGTWGKRTRRYVSSLLRCTRAD